MYTKLFFILAVVALCHGNQDEWNMFKKEHNKTYSSAAEEAKRCAIFKETLKKIRRHNFEADLNKHSYRMGINQFSDLNKDEREKMKGSNPPAAKLRTSTPSLNLKASDARKIPASLDLRTTGCVTSIKNQGQCGSCYSFAAAAVMEYLYCKQSGTAVSLSEESLINCSPGVNQCNGGWPTHCFDFVQGEGAASTLESYPYTAADGTCTFNSSTNLPINIKDYYSVFDSPNEEGMKIALFEHGPLAVAIDATGNFDNYVSGVYSADDCTGQGVNHAVTVIGYGTEKGQDYWLIKNSWGTWWGEEGYMKMARNKNMCDIAEYPYYLKGTSS